MFDVWATYAGQEYVVFIDESFHRFMRMTESDSRYGHFTYGAVGVPLKEYSRLKEVVAPTLEKYVSLVSKNEVEFKHTKFKRIEFVERANIAYSIATALISCGGFVSGFYTPGERFVLGHVRDKVMETQEQMPDDTTRLYKTAVEEVRQHYYLQGDKAELLATLLTLPISAISNMLAEFECPFRVVLDPRERREDASVKEKVESLSEVIGIMSPEAKGWFRGVDIGTNSSAELGLQLADLVAGETKEFLHAFPEVMSIGATSRIISQESTEDFEAVDVMAMDGVEPFVYKFGAMTRMPMAMAQAFVRPDPGGRTAFHLLSGLLASGVLTCYSDTGGPRHVMPFIRAVIDQCDR